VLRVRAARVRVVRDDEIAWTKIELEEVEDRARRHGERRHVNRVVGDDDLAGGAGEGDRVVARLAHGGRGAVVLQGDAHVVRDRAKVAAQDLPADHAARPAAHCATWITYVR